jgi:hypothetical protein
MAAKNAQLEAPFRDFLLEVIEEPQRHAAFLNMLSMLEHIGSRKIMTSQMRGVLTQEILKHLAEETRHAFFFKRQAEKIAGRGIEGYNADNTLTYVPAQMYFGRLDAEITKTLPEGCNGAVPYLYVSLIVELRACWAYALYQDVLKAAGSPFSLKSIMAEEELHLGEMYAALEALDAITPEELDALCSLETALFKKFWRFLPDSSYIEEAARGLT